MSNRKPAHAGDDTATAAGLGIAVAPGAKHPWWNVLRQVFARQFLQVVAVLVLLLFGTGALVWLTERKRNPQQWGRIDSLQIRYLTIFFRDASCTRAVPRKRMLVVN